MENVMNRAHTSIIIIGILMYWFHRSFKQVNDDTCLHLLKMIVDAKQTKKASCIGSACFFITLLHPPHICWLFP
ncbi:hypothetical protein ACERJO_01625 [Halalkalibacter sp. AB-rgal2]|uniref:hypothetical protein n=1 Tax=Halalkalibacter sp. AB-rgal2 TaxID=3242695 RepID=UPI00359E17C7